MPVALLFDAHGGLPIAASKPWISAIDYMQAPLWQVWPLWHTVPPHVQTPPVHVAPATQSIEVLQPQWPSRGSPRQA